MTMRITVARAESLMGCSLSARRLRSSRGGGSRLRRATHGQVEVEDALLILVAADLLLRDQEVVTQNGAIDDGAVRGGDQKLCGVDEDDVDSILLGACLQDGVVALGAEHAAGGAD